MTARPAAKGSFNQTVLGTEQTHWVTRYLSIEADGTMSMFGANMITFFLMDIANSVVRPLKQVEGLLYSSYTSMPRLYAVTYVTVYARETTYHYLVEDVCFAFMIRGKK